MPPRRKQSTHFCSAIKQFERKKTKKKQTKKLRNILQDIIKISLHTHICIQDLSNERISGKTDGKENVQQKKDCPLFCHDHK